MNAPGDTPPTARRRRGLVRHHSEHATATGIYGIIVVAAVLATSHAETAVAVDLAVLVTLVIYWAAERYARLVAARIHEGARPDWSHVRRELTTGWGALWGLLFGAMFAVPVLGVAAGAATGGLLKAREGLGITEEQLGRIKEQITEGTSALFVVTESADLDKLGERLRGWHSKLLETNLTAGERQILRETVGES